MPVAAHVRALIPLAREFAKFGIVGFIGFLVDALFLQVGLHVVHLGKVAAGYFSFPFAVTVTWLGNRLFTFRHVEHEPMAKQLGKFVVVCSVGLIFNRGTYSLCVLFVPLINAYPVLGLVAGTAAGMFFNFFASKKVVFVVKEPPCNPVERS
jgi:putative flippase GtrA